jgi:proteasome lid subunit RPN8/RPN11
MGSHARETLPEECCGLLVGPGPGRFEEIHRCRNDMTLLHQRDRASYPRDGTRAFHMSEIDYARIQQYAEERGGRVTGVYHSHVEAGAYFSEMDQQFVLQPLFPFPDAEHFVLAVADRKVREVAAFRWLPDQERFIGRPVAAEAPLKDRGEAG